MGSRQGDTGHDGSQAPQHAVTFAQPFAVGTFPVTFAEWDACAAVGGCGRYKPDDAGWGRGDRPVINVSWNDAKAYVGWLSRIAGGPYRLLSEAEREYVTRAGTTTPFWWGKSVTPEQANYNGNYPYSGSPQKGEYRAKTVPVLSFLPNPWGLYQVHGNVWEWVEDCWHDNYNGAPGDGVPWAGKEPCRHIVRGGGWDRIPQVLDAAYRASFSASYRYTMIGLRVAKSEPGGKVSVKPRPAPLNAVAQAPAAVSPAPASMAPSVTLVSGPPPAQREGHVDMWKYDQGALIIIGWALWQPGKGGLMMIDTNLPAAKVSVRAMERPDVVTAMNNSRLANSGFEVTIRLDADKPKPDSGRVCIWTEDPELGQRATFGWELCPG